MDVREFSLSSNLPTAGGRRERSMYFPRVLAQSEMQAASSMFRTQPTNDISSSC